MANGTRRRRFNLDKTIAALQVLRTTTSDYAVAIHSARNAIAVIDDALAVEKSEDANFIQEIFDHRERLADERATVKARAKQKSEANSCPGHVTTIHIHQRLLGLASSHHLHLLRLLVLAKLER